MGGDGERSSGVEEGKEKKEKEWSTVRGNMLVCFCEAFLKMGRVIMSNQNNSKVSVTLIIETY